MKYLILLVPVALLAANTDFADGSHAAQMARWYPAPSDRQVSISWASGPNCPVAFCRGATGVINGKIYAFDGQQTPSAVHFSYDIATQTYDNTLAPDPYAASNSKGVVYNNELYILGGYSPNEANFRKYDPASDSWTDLTSPPGYTVIYKNGVGVVNGKIYYYCGRFEANHYTTLCYEYDPVSDSWTQKTDFTGTGRSYFGSASDGTYCYVVGGYASGTVLTDCWRYDAGNDSWAAVDNYPEQLIFGDCDFLKGTLFSAGGGGGYGSWPALQSVYYWEDGTGWTSTDNLPAAVGIPHNELYSDGTNDYIFCFGGYNGTYLNTMYIGTITGSGVSEGKPSPPIGMKLTVTPNLIKDQATIEFQLASDSHVSIKMRDVGGRVVSDLVNSNYSSGIHQVRLTSNNLPAGVYIVEMKASVDRLTEKVVKVR